MTENILVSRKEAMRLADIKSSNLRALIARGRLVEGDALIEGTVRKGVTLASLAIYYEWSASTVQQILIAHGVPVDSNGHHYLVGPDE